jgi:hypothetical protein
MGIHINRNNILEETRSIRESIEKTKHQVSLIFESINKFNDTKGELTGKAWDAAREYSESVLLPVLRMYIECLDLEYDANGKYSESAERLPGYEKLDEDIIITAKEKFERLLDRECNRRHPRNSVINFYEKKIARCEKLLDIIGEFCDETSGIFNEVKSRHDYLSRLHYYLKMINVDKATGEMLLPPGSVNIQYAKDEIDRYYRGIKSKELIEREKELEEIYKLKGAMAVIQNILTKPVEGRLNTDIESAEYTMIARLMVESRDDEYVELINTAVYYCYEYEKTMSNHQGYFNTVNDIYKKNDKVDKILGGLNNFGLHMNFKAKNEQGDIGKLIEDRRYWMQLTQAFSELSTYDAKIVATKLYSRESDRYPAKSKGYNVEVKQDVNHQLIISFLKYGGDVGGTSTTPYEQQKDVRIIVSIPDSGASGESEALKGSMEYVYYGMEMDKTLPGTVVKSSSNCLMTLALGAYASTVGNTVTVLNSVKEISAEAVGEKRKLYKKAEYMQSIGKVVQIFDLFYVSSVVEEDGKKDVKTQNCGIFPRYRIDDLEKMATSECIENFNINFSKGGRFEKYASDMGYDENNPITEENIVNRASEIDYMLDQFKIAMSKNGMVTFDIENAVRRAE